MFKFKRSKSLSRAGRPGDSTSSPTSSSHSVDGNQDPQPVRRGSDPTNSGANQPLPRPSTPADSTLSYTPFYGENEGASHQQHQLLPDIAHVSPFIAPDYNRIVSGTIPTAPAIPTGHPAAYASTPSPPGSLTRKTVTFNDDFNTIHRPPPSPASTVAAQTPPQAAPATEMESLPMLPSSLASVPRDDLESLVQSLHADALASRMLVEQARASEAVHKAQLDKVAARAFKSITTLREKAAGLEAELGATREQLGQVSGRFARVMSILAVAVPGLVPGEVRGRASGSGQVQQAATSSVQLAAGGQPV